MPSLIVETYWRNTALHRKHGFAGKPLDHGRVTFPNTGWESAKQMQQDRRRRDSKYAPRHRAVMCADGFYVFGDSGTIQRVRVTDEPGPMMTPEEVAAACREVEDAAVVA